MSGGRRKSHIMITRLDKSLGFNDTLYDSPEHKENIVPDCDGVHPLKVSRPNVSHLSTSFQSRVKPPTVLYRTPFYPKPSTRSPLIPISPELATSRRAMERMRFEEQLERRRKSVQARLLRSELERKKQEEQEIAELRKQLVHKPQPIRRYRSIRLPRPKPLTVPNSPELLTRTRAHGKG